MFMRKVSPCHQGSDVKILHTQHM